MESAGSDHAEVDLYREGSRDLDRVGEDVSVMPSTISTPAHRSSDQDSNCSAVICPGIVGSEPVG